MQKKEIWNAGAEGNETRKRITDKKYNLMKSKQGDAMYETIGTEYSYWGKTTEVSGSQAAGSSQWMTSLTGTSKLGTGYYNGDYVLIGHCPHTFVGRGGYWDSGDGTGVFSVHEYFGSLSEGIAFRPVLAI